MKRIFLSLSIFLFSLAHGMQYPISATPSWIEVADRSSFVGIIECVYARSTVSEFKVTETWKGGSIDGTFHYPGCYRPGGRLLVCMEPDRRVYEVYRYRLDDLLQPVGGGELFLSTWPEVAPDYQRADSIVGSDIPLAADGSDDIQHFYKREHATLGEFREALRELLCSDGARREAILIRGALSVLLEAPSNLNALSLTSPTGAPVERNELDVLLQAILRPENGLDHERIGWAISRAGGEYTVRYLESRTPEDAMCAAWLSKIREDIETRLARSATKGDRYIPKVLPPLSKAEARKGLVQFRPVEGRTPEWLRAVQTLIDSDPVFLAGYIADFDPSPFPYRGATSNFALWFAQNCPAEHVKCYRKLSKSKLPAVAAVGALYLSFADPEEGLTLLERKATKPGPLSQWAADALVLHGRRDYVAQALASVRDDETNSGAPLLPPLASGVAAVLANAAHEAGITLPLDDRGGATRLFLRLDSTPLSWWKEHGDALAIKPLPLHWPIQSTTR